MAAVQKLSSALGAFARPKKVAASEKVEEEGEKEEEVKEVEELPRETLLARTGLSVWASIGQQSRSGALNMAQLRQAVAVRKRRALGLKGPLYEKFRKAAHVILGRIKAERRQQGIFGVLKAVRAHLIESNNRVGACRPTSVLCVCATLV